MSSALKEDNEYTVFLISSLLSTVQAGRKRTSKCMWMCNHFLNKKLRRFFSFKISHCHFLFEKRLLTTMDFIAKKWWGHFSEEKWWWHFSFQKFLHINFFSSHLSPMFFFLEFLFYSVSQFCLLFTSMKLSFPWVLFLFISFPIHSQICFDIMTFSRSIQKPTPKINGDSFILFFQVKKARNILDFPNDLSRCMRALFLSFLSNQMAFTLILLMRWGEQGQGSRMLWKIKCFSSVGKML